MKHPIISNDDVHTVLGTLCFDWDALMRCNVKFVGNIGCWIHHRVKSGKQGYLNKILNDLDILIWWKLDWNIIFNHIIWQQSFLFNLILQVLQHHIWCLDSVNSFHLVGVIGWKINLHITRSGNTNLTQQNYGS